MTAKHNFLFRMIALTAYVFFVVSCGNTKGNGDAGNTTDDKATEENSTETESEMKTDDSKNDSNSEEDQDTAIGDNDVLARNDTASDDDTGGDDHGTSNDGDTGDNDSTDNDSDTDDNDDTDNGDNAASDIDTDSAQSSKSCKRGISLEYGKQSVADMEALSPGVSWWYNWSPAPEGDLEATISDLDMAFVPMWWGTGIDIDSVASAVRDDSTYILGFNEPNFHSQANLSSADAAAAWPNLETVADDHGLSLVSPAVNYCGGGCHNTDPFAYLDDFFDACSGCRVDHIAIHIYVECSADDPGLQNNRAQWLINHVNSYIERFSEPLWLTEFACSGDPSVEEQRAFMTDAVAFLENESRIFRYAWFAGRVNVMTNVNLLGEDGALTSIGETYISLPFNDECE